MRYTLTGDWTLQTESGKTWPGQLPGCSYLDLLRAGAIDDPFWAQNEAAGTEVAKQDFTYTRTFTLPDGADWAHMDLVVAGLDTLGEIYLNGTLLQKTDNCHRTYRLAVQDVLQSGENEIRLLLRNPFVYLAQRHKALALASASSIKGVPHLRKVQCHFGWDWGPILPPAGLLGDIYLEGYNLRVADVQILQHHENGAVELEIHTALSEENDALQLVCSLTHPDGYVQQSVHPFVKGKRFTVNVENPQLWWCNGLGEQPLYTVEIQLQQNGQTLDTQEKIIGLRTIVLDTSRDQWGTQFRFIINGVSIFAKGANWIPTDAFVTRTTKEELRFYIESAKTANMNMLRIWGGGHYESDTFYELCDRNGILVWQDFPFACGVYPFHEPAFLETVRCEVQDNVRRLRHHASLALWCGNNENELFLMLARGNKRVYEANMSFYYDTLRAWATSLDAQTPYWPGSPSSGKRGRRSYHMDHGDNHLWQVWHGLMPIEAFRKMPARFCSEFGVESFPSMRAVRAFTDIENPDILDPVMLTHQKSKGGNQKILFYLLAKYRNPTNFADFAYLSQLVQSGAIRFATDEWRRRRGRCNGSLYWQYNDCWPVASWAGIDYLKQPKALHYHARHFNRPVCLSNDYFRDRAELYVANDLPQALTATLDWGFFDFAGNCIQRGTAPVAVGALESKRVLRLQYGEHLGATPKQEAVLCVTLRSKEGVLDEKSWLLVPDKYARLQRPNIQTSVTLQGTTAQITLQTDTFARYVRLESACTAEPFSDNFFDIPGGGSVTVTVEVPAGTQAQTVAESLHIKTLADVPAKNSMQKDNRQRFFMRFQKVNFFTWLGYKFLR